MKWLKRLLLIVGILLVLAIVSSAIGYRLLQGTPKFYHAYKWSEEDRTRLAEQVRRKLADPYNDLARASATESAQMNGDPATSPATNPASQMVSVSLDEEELNAFLTTWTDGSAYQAYVRDPGIYFGNGQIILAGTGRLGERTAVVSLLFRPEIDAQGRLHLHLDRCLAGQLPVPQSMLEPMVSKLRQSVERRLPAWRQKAKLDRNGGFNDDARAAALADLLLNTLADKPSAAVAFVPLNGIWGAVRLRKIEVTEGKLTLTAERLGAPERQAMIEGIRGKGE